MGRKHVEKNGKSGEVIYLNNEAIKARITRQKMTIRRTPQVFPEKKVLMQIVQVNVTIPVWVKADSTALTTICGESPFRL